MSQSSASLPSQRLEAAVAEFFEGEERGQPLDRAALLARYPDVANELNEFFADHDQLARAIPPYRPASHGLDPTLVAEITPAKPADATLPWGTTSDPALRIGPYAVLEELGRGGMGVVYRARHRELGRVVALKTLLAGRMASAEDRQRFRAEALAAARLSHPGIVPIFEVGDDAGTPYFAMPLVEGENLAAWLRHGPMKPHDAVRVLRKIVAAVDYAHAHGVVHRDLKPGNVLLATEASGALCPLITDFGLAKCLDSDELTASGQILGTPAYMPPEQAAGRRHEVGPAADIYALGAILYAMLTGRPPFVSENPVEVLLQVIEREPPLPCSLCAGVPRELEWICLKCLEKKPGDRYATAAELGADLDRYLRREPPLARLPGMVHRVRRWIRRKPVLAAHAIGLATPLAIAQVVFAVQPDRDLAYHARVCAALVLWLAASAACQWLLEQRRTSPWPLYVWAAADALLLTGLLSLMVSPLGVFVGGYLLLVAVSALAGQTRLVAFTTAAAMLGHLTLLLLRPEESRPLHYAIFAQMTLALLGLAVGYQVWRMQVLREYYGERV